MKDLNLQCKSEHANQDEDWAERREAVSQAENEHRKAEDKKRLQEVYNSMVHERISFNFVKIHLMLHYEETVRCFAHLVKNSSKTQGINHPKMCMGPYCPSKHNICYAQPIFNNYSPIHILWMLLLHLRQLAKEGHWTPDIQQALQLYQPTGQIIVNICNHELVPVLENIPLSFRKDEGNIQVHGLRSHRRKGFFVQNEDHPMFNFPLIEYLY
jgi:hypothetical protein